jgi:hypothetical protein
LLPLLLLLLPAVVQAQSYTNNYDIWAYTSNSGTITITGYNGPGGDVTIPSVIDGLPVSNIGGDAFGCSMSVSLGNVTIPDSVTNIESWAFVASSITSVTIGKGVIGIGEQAFVSDLTAITVDALNPVYSSIEGVLYDKSKATLIRYPGGKPGDYTLPDSVSRIGGSAFYNCQSLTSITIPASVSYIGDQAFFGCSSLNAITVDSQNAFFSTADGVLFKKDGNLLIKFPSARGGSYAIPSGVKRIGDLAFDGDGLRNIFIPSSVSEIGDKAFSLSCITNFYFSGNAPNLGFMVFPMQWVDGTQPTLYYLPGTTGWSTTFGERPTATWLLTYPVILTTAPNFGIQTNQFGFIISWATNISVVVEASTNLTNPIWVPLQTNTLIGGSSFFSDPQWTNYPGRFYRLHSP